MENVISKYSVVILPTYCFKMKAYDVNVAETSQTGRVKDVTNKFTPGWIWLIVFFSKTETGRKITLKMNLKKPKLNIYFSLS